jgi:GNAT superfamily N-acetyltransferase
MLTFWNQPHPEPTDVSKASYYAILDLLILPSFRGKKDRVRKVSIARVIFEWIESRARAREDCVGMTLVVQEGNTHAVEVYKHFDFRVVRRVVEAWAVYLEMRRNF